jgi:preprotein translocase subunit SecB
MAVESTPAPAQPSAGTPVTVAAQYVKDFSFESPNAPQIFTPTQIAPEITMGVNVHTRNMQGSNYEVLLALKLEAKLEGKTGFIAELVYGGVFVLPTMPEDQLRLFLLVEAPRLLFPFARGILANAVREGGFPHVMINPIDFMGLYLANKNNVGTMTAAGAA